MLFELTSKFQPQGDQKKAIPQLVANLKHGVNYQVLLGATGTGKTFTIANVINEYQKPTLILVHNKTLAMQLFGELKSFFPKNRVEYFVSYFDFYQPEAYLPQTDTYIDKNSKDNEEIKMLRLSALNALTTRKDVIVVASVAAIYGEQEPDEYKKNFFELRKGQTIDINDLAYKLMKNGYVRNDQNLEPGTFSVVGDLLKLKPSWTEEYYLRFSININELEEIAKIENLNNVIIEKYPFFTVFPAQHYIMSAERIKLGIENLRKELAERLEYFRKEERFLEAKRLEQRVLNDIANLEEFGICSGIENYAPVFEQRFNHEAPYTLLDYFKNDFLTIIDESHITIPQIRGMYNTNLSRKQTLIEYGFRLPSAIENRPLNLAEFLTKNPKMIFTSATPGDFELDLIKTTKQKKPIEQIIRPTGLVDPTIEIKSGLGQMDDIILQIQARKQRNERVFITTLTINMAEELTHFLQERGLQVTYLHNELKTLERTKVLFDLRRGVYDAVVGINLLREGLDIPEVALVCILDADKTGFLRNTRSLIQTIGRAARNVNGHVILYADSISDAMKQAIVETKRRRELQQAYNKKHGIVPKTIIKDLNEIISVTQLERDFMLLKTKNKKAHKAAKEQVLQELRTQMQAAAKNWEFEKAATLRDLIIHITNEE